MKPNLGIIQGELAYTIFFKAIKQIKHQHISEGNEEVWEYVRDEVYMSVQRRTILHSTWTWHSFSTTATTGAAIFKLQIELRDKIDEEASSN